MAAREITVVKQKYQTGDGTDLFLSSKTKVEADANGKYVPGSATTTLSLHDTGGNILGDSKPIATRGADGNWVLSKDGNGNLVAGLDLQKSLANRNSMLNINLNNHIKQSMGAPLQGVPAGQVNNNNSNDVASAIGIGKNTAPNTAGTSTPEQLAAASANEAKNFKEGTRKSYDTNIKYPENLSLFQDVIKFSILEYSPSLAAGNRSESGLGSNKNRVVILEDGGNPIVKGSNPIGVITLPIPAGISDGNSVGWQGDSLNMLQSAAAKTADTLLSGGTVDEATKVGAGGVKQSLSTGDASNTIRGIFSQMAVQAGGIIQRTQGAVLNNNLELLFSGPSLRQFSFTFYFYPRRKEEAIIVRKIIRAFKQAMSVKRSATSLLLKSPHTFAIQYMTLKDGKAVAHPYLNRFKECALTSCNVDYTPDGTYMTYNDPEKSMTAYRLSLSFQELEPLFDDEYGLDDDNVGF